MFSIKILNKYKKDTSTSLFISVSRYKKQLREVMLTKDSNLKISPLGFV